MACLSCGRGFHDECEIGCVTCHADQVQLIKSFKTSNSIAAGEGAPIKDQQNIKDRLSTGRKRAAMLYPLFRDQPCEWQGKKNCGGGQPIIGCINGLQQHRHHGPVKDPVHNELGNVHRICNNCHSRWHAVNDPVYNEEEYKNTRHQPEDAEEMELLANEAKWRIKR